MRILDRQPLILILAGVGALAMLIPAGHALALDQPELAGIFAMSCLLGLVVIVLMGVASMARPAGDSTRTMLLTVVGTMTLLPAFFAVPLATALPDTGFFNAWWEMVSCLTTNGASLYSAEKLAAPLNLWRSLVGWMGGLFILTAATAILAPLRIGGFEIMTATSGEEERDPRMMMPGGRREGGGPPSHLSSPSFHSETIDPVNRMSRAAKTVFPVYLGLTVLLWTILSILGDPGLVALARAMGTLSVSGISPVSSGLGAQSGIAGEVAVFLLLIPALSRRLWPGGREIQASERWRDDPELRLAALIVALVTTAVFARHFIGAIEIKLASGGETEPRFASALGSFWGGLFNTLSYLTTTGWNSSQWQSARNWSGLTSPGLILAGLALMGGGVATAAGGVKLLRIYALMRHSEREMEKLIHPSSIGGGGRLGRRLRAEGGFLAFVFFMLFALSIAVVIVLISLQRIEFESATILAIAALTNTGPLAGAIPLTPAFEGSAGIAGAPWAGWAGLPDFTKAILAGAMVVGRIETLALLALFNRELWRR